jgi:hypothetical protein
VRAQVRASSVAALACVLALALFCVPAQATTFAPRPEGGGFVENSDGTWSLWGEGDKEPLHTYTAAEHTAMGEYYEAMEEDVASVYLPSATGSNVSGITVERITGAKELVEKLETGELYKSKQEQEIGNEIVDDSETDGFLPTVETEFTDGIATEGTGFVVADAGPVVAGVAASGLIGVTIGNGIDEIFGLPKLELGGSPSKGPAESQKRYELVASLGGGSGITEFGRLLPCNEAGGPTGYGHGELCGAVGFNYNVWTEFERGGKWEREETPNTHENVSYLVGSKIFQGKNEEPSCVQIQGVGEGEDSAAKCKEVVVGEHGEEFELFTYWTLRSLIREAFPKAGLKEKLVCTDKLNPSECHNGGTEGFSSYYPTKTLPEPTPITVPQPGKTLVGNDQPRKVEEYIAKEREKEDLPGIGGNPIPNPLEIEIPKPETNELGTHYVSRLHELGFTNVVEVELPIDDSDPRVGPSEVAYTSPSYGTSVAPDTTVIVEIDPEDAPPPIGPPPSNGGPELPGIKFPHLGVLCKSFPFGVPCWLYSEFQAWSATGKAPVLGMSSFTVQGHTIPGATFDTAKLEPIMEKIRPWIIFFVTISIVLVFYKWATGKGPGTSPDIPDGDHPADSIPANDSADPQGRLW